MNGRDPHKIIRVLVVEDSQTVAEWLTHALTLDGGISVVGVARDGEEALEAAHRLRPDVITMDILMPKLNGFEATRRIMETCPTPILIVSAAANLHEIATEFRVLEAGALAVLARPPGGADPRHDSSVVELIKTIKLMSEVKVVRRWPRAAPAGDRAAVGPNRAMPRVAAGPASGSVRAIAIGASTGGPLALRTVLSGLPITLGAPVLIVQHMTAGFVSGFAEWLAQSSGFPVRVAADGESLLPGRAYLAPDGFHMGVRADNRIYLSDDAQIDGLRPAVSFLFHSVRQAFAGDVVAVLLTGMGQDGVTELKRLKECGAVTIAQDEESSVIHGMPGQAIRIGGATHILPPEVIADTLATLVTQGPVPRRKS